MYAATEVIFFFLMIEYSGGNILSYGNTFIEKKFTDVGGNLKGILGYFRKFVN